MKNVVIDTNVLVSALLSPEGSPAKMLALALNEQIVICYDSRIMLEYEDVLFRPKFSFAPQDVDCLLSTIVKTGNSVIAQPLSDAFHDESDKKFYEVAKTAEAYLITGNDKHFPAEAFIISPLNFLTAEHNR